MTIFFFQLINRTTLRKVINVDARNHGESPHTKEMSLPLMTKDIFHLMKQCNFKDQFSDGRKFSFMGHHMGGRIGMLLALTQPYKVCNLGKYVSKQILFKIDIFEEIKIVFDTLYCTCLVKNRQKHANVIKVHTYTRYVL